MSVICKDSYFGKGMFSSLFIHTNVLYFRLSYIEISIKIDHPNIKKETKIEDLKVVTRVR